MSAVALALKLGGGIEVLGQEATTDVGAEGGAETCLVDLDANRLLLAIS